MFYYSITHNNDVNNDVNMNVMFTTRSFILGNHSMIIQSWMPCHSFTPTELQ